MNIAENIVYIGCDDTELDLFESQYKIPHGVSYNSYVCFDEKTVVFDTVDKRKTDEWLKNLENALGGVKPDYLLINHMEPDHSASLRAFFEKYPHTTLIGNDKTFIIAERYFGKLQCNKLVVKDGDELSLGKHVLKFIFAPMVHWPEVMLTYDKTAKVLFSADAFGKFGALSYNEEWLDEARRYYINIVGKYGASVQGVLKKAAALDIRVICPLHGPVLKDNLEFYINKYNVWSSYASEDEGVLIAYASVYGGTKKAAEILAENITSAGHKAVLADLARSDLAEVVANAFRYDKLVIASVTLDGGLFPATETFINELKAKNYRNRTVAFIENGSWAPVSGKLMRGQMETIKNLKIIDKTVTVESTVKEDTKAQLKELCGELLK